MSKYPEGYVVRPVRLDDVDALAVYANEYLQFVGSGETIDPGRLAGQLSSPGFDLETSSVAVFTPEGRPVASAFVMDFADPPVCVNGSAMVHPDHQGKGLGTAMHGWMRTRASEAIDRVPEGVRVLLSQTALDTDRTTLAFLRLQGYDDTRHFWRMEIRFDGPPLAPSWPKGIEIRQLDPERDLVAAVEAGSAAFSDHYGHVETPLEERLGRRRHRMKSDPTYDPGLEFLAWDGDQVAGFVYAAPQHGSDKTMGYIPSLGVLRPWRKRGLGLALLQHAFHVLHDRGKAGVALHVDAQSLTGATRLYEKAGMHVAELSHEFTLELRPGVDMRTTQVA